MNKRLLALALLIPAVFFVVACGNDDTKDSQSVPTGNTQGVAATVTGQTTNTPVLISATPTTVTFPFDNATQARDSLLTKARSGAAMDQYDKNDPIDPAAYPAWASSYPTLRLVGSSVNATAQTASVFRNTLKDKEAASATNPKVIVFAVMDTKGACAAGVARGFPNYNDYAPVDIGSSPCNASAALAVLRK